MALQQPTSTSATTVVANLGDTDDCYVGQDVWIQTTAINTIYATGSDQSIEVNGWVQGVHTIWLGDNDVLDQGYKVLIGQTGRVDASINGLFLTASNSRITNHGLVIAENLGLVLGGHDPAGKTVVRNDGTISGDYGGVYSNSATETIVLFNTGTIHSRKNAYWSSENYNDSGVDKVYNSGRMAGDIVLATGKDLYDGRKGEVTGNVYGGADNDHLIGGAGNERLHGDSGADVVQGGGGADEMWGGGDRFVFASLSDSSPTSTGRDTIHDYADDIFDLRLIDADKTHGGNQKFDFIGGHNFGGHAGELRFEAQGAYTFVSADVDGDRHADFGFRIDGDVQLKASAFLL